MPKFEYEMDEQVAILTMDSGENRFNPPFFEAFTEVLDKIENDTDARVLVVKSANAKIWSNGIDLDWLGPAIAEGGLEVRDKFLAEMFTFLKRFLTYPLVTVAAITGHAFAGGAFLSFTHDFRFMRSDRGWLCLPEVDIGIPIGPVFTAISKGTLAIHVFEELQYTGKRLTAEECVERNIVMKALHIDDLMTEALAFAKTLNKEREMIRQLKLDTHKDTIAVIDETVAELSSGK
jgi:enoyl-CoA hydratase/carnithine racemase